MLIFFLILFSCASPNLSACKQFATTGMGRRDTPFHVWLRQGALWSPLTCSQQQGALRAVLAQEAQVPVQKSVLCTARCSDSQGADSRRFPSKSCRWLPPCRMGAFSVGLRLGSHVALPIPPAKGSFPVGNGLGWFVHWSPPWGCGMIPHRGVTCNGPKWWFLWFYENHKIKSYSSTFYLAWQ